LLPGLDGVEKMSKSLDNYIGIDEPADILFEKCMKVPDGILADYFRLTTDIPEEEYAPLLTADARQAHFVYAREIVCLYQGGDAVAQAEQRYRSVASGAAPDQMETILIAEPEISLISLLKDTGFAASNSEARRLIEGKGIKLDGAVVEDANLILKADAVLSRGKNRFVQVRF
jgi:tyrosyl-tRNA synthetase